MKCPSAQAWELVAVEAADSASTEALLGHAAQCAACREQLAEARRAHFDRIRMYEVFDRDHDQLREQLLAALPAENPEPNIRGARVRLGELFMSINTRTTRRFITVLAPAACIVFAALTFLLPGQRSAFAKALERMREAQTITCRYMAYLNGSETPMQTGAMVLSEEHGMRFDAQTDTSGLGAPGSFNMCVVRQADGPIFMIQPAFKIAFKMNVPPGFSGFSGASGPMSGSSPDAFLSNFRKMTGDADRVLGRSIMEGREVEGYAVSGRKIGVMPVGRRSQDAADENEARLYIDTATDMPVKMEMDLTQSMSFFGALQLRVVIDQIEIDKPVDASLFIPQVPEDFRVVAVTLSLPSEEVLLEALRLYREATGGYPAILDPAQLCGAMSMAQIASGKIKVDPADPGSMLSSELMQASMTVALGCTYAQQLEAEGREPEYFGDTVTTADANRTLMQWTLPDGRRRIIRGDLTLETVDAPK